jgi:hypothetical protein
VARSVQSLDFDITDVEGLAVCGYFGDFAAVSATDDGERVGFQLVSGQFCSLSCYFEDEKASTYHFDVTASMVVVARMC